jgi:RNA polymerase sigma-70 factor (ECF subfamily)
MGIAFAIAPGALAATAEPEADVRADSLEQEREAVRACQRGEREAFDRLVTRYQRDVYRLCYRYVNNHHDADDLAQEAFLRAYRALPRFRGESSFATWLYRIAINACLNFRAARRPPGEAASEALADSAPSPAERLARDEDARRVREAVGRLPDRQRATLILRTNTS